MGQLTQDNSNEKANPKGISYGSTKSQTEKANMHLIKIKKTNMHVYMYDQGRDKV